VPEYFAEYREKGDGLAAFLGTSIVAKVRAAECTEGLFVESSLRSRLMSPTGRTLCRRQIITRRDHMLL
jgi:hypothetical protein